MWPWEIHLTRFHPVFIRIPSEWGSSPDMLVLFTRSGVHSDYLGALPPLFPPLIQQPRLHSRVAQECHTVSIRLAAQIWASACRSFYSRIHPSSPARPSVTLPVMFSRILPPSPSYPSFSVSFD